MPKITNISLEENDDFCCNGEMIRLHLNEIMHCPRHEDIFDAYAICGMPRIKFAILGIHSDSLFLYMARIQSSLTLFNYLFLVCQFFFTIRGQFNKVRKLNLAT